MPSHGQEWTFVHMDGLLETRLVTQEISSLDSHPETTDAYTAD